MDTQCDSIDIAKLRDFALGIGDLGEVSIFKICPGDAFPIMRAGLLTPSTMQTQEPDVSPQIPAPTNSRDNDYKAQRIEDDSQSKTPEDKVGHNGRDGSAVAGLRHQTKKSHPPRASSVLRLTASQPRLPSTVADSHEIRMAMAGYQSQGDTQPLSQGVQEEFTSRIKERQGMSITDTTGMQDRSYSYQPGETGHIDFVTDYEQPSAAYFEEHNGADDDIDPISQAADVRAELYPESKRFQEPKTPATAGNKRSKDGATLSRENTTPRLPVNPFASQNGRFEGMMNASQAFKATQFTSPLPNQAIAEGFSDRPSPEMSNPPRPSTADPLSSPAKLPRSNMARAVTEPQTRYVSMKESQAERDRLSKLAAPLAQEDSDDGFDSDGSELRRRRKRRRLEMEAKSLFEGVTAGPRPGSSGPGRGGRRAYTQRSSPRRPSGRAPTEAVLISDDPLAEGNDTEDETEHEQERSESDTDSIDELAEDNKENIGVKRVQVPMTASRANPGRTTRISSQLSPSRFRVQKSPSPMRSMEASKMRPILSTASTEAAGSLPKATQTVAIVDSQPSRSTNSRRSPNPFRQESVVFQSSLDMHTVVPQSQVSLEAGSGARDGVRPPAGTPNVPTGSAIQSSPNTSSSAFPQAGHPDTATSGQGRRTPVSVPTRNDTTSTDHNSSSSLCPPDDQAMAAKHKSTAVAKDLTPSHEAALDTISEKPREKPALGDINTSDEGHRPQSQHDTHGLTSLEEQTTQIRVSSTIPETSSAMTRIEQQISSHSSSGRRMFTNGASRPDSGAEPSHLVQSDASTTFNTAATHLPTSPIKSRNTQGPSKPSTPNSKNTRSRTIAEIAANPSPPDPIGSVDVDVDFLSKDDREFQAIMSGSSPVLPARKRRRGRNGQILLVADSDTNMVPPPPGSEPPTSSAAENVASSPQRQGVEHTVQKTPATSPGIEDRASSQPRLGVEQPSEVISDNSAVQKHSGRTPSRDTAPPPSAMQTNSRKRGRPRKNIKGDVELDRQSTNRPERDTSAANKTLRIEVPQRRTGDPNGSASSESGPIIAPNQVLAHFNGNCPGYYPATCIGITGGEDSQYRVRFDDGMIDTINGYGIKRLELRRGDYVKLDQVGARKHVYIIERVHDRQQALLTPDPETPRHHVPLTSRTSLGTSQTDIRGYASVVVTLKQANAPDKNSSNQSITVPVKDVYLTQTMWTSLKDRSYTYKPLHPPFPSRLQTPSERISNPSTPSSRSRRLKTSSTTHPHSTLQTSSASTTTGIFTTMAFAITNISDATLRTALRHQITTNGGRLLADGFDELLHIPSLGPASPSKRSPKKNGSATSFSAFDLTETGKQTGFTCLLADKHCRMAKYIQALALGIPCLSTRWIQDCVAKQRLLPWQPYLLAAGDSSFLGGAVRSRILPTFPPESTSLKDIIGTRGKPLDGDSVLLIMEKGEEEKMKSHPLITHALGASKVSRAASLEAAARATKDAEINGEPWTWVFSLDKEDKTEKALFGRGLGGRKRKRESGVGGNGINGHGGVTRVVGNEFVIQSLILGQLVE